MATLTLPGVLLSGTHGARPAASTVGKGTLYAETDTGQTYQSDGVSTWTAWGHPAGGGVTELDYTQITSPASSITATTEGSANTVITSGAVTCDGSTPIEIEFWAPYIRSRANNVLFIVLYEDGSSIGLMALAGGGSVGDFYNPGVLGRRKLTPTAGSHTFSIRAYIGGGSAGEVGAGAGGSGNYLPAFTRITQGS
jgi:hypothetical protein